MTSGRTLSKFFINNKLNFKSNQPIFSKLYIVANRHFFYFSCCTPLYYEEFIAALINFLFFTYLHICLFAYFLICFLLFAVCLLPFAVWVFRHFLVFYNFSLLLCLLASLREIILCPSPFTYSLLPVTLRIKKYKQLPFPGSDSTQIFLLCVSTIFFIMQAQ